MCKGIMVGFKNAYIWGCFELGRRVQWWHPKQKRLYIKRKGYEEPPYVSARKTRQDMWLDMKWTVGLVFWTKTYFLLKIMPNGIQEKVTVEKFISEWLSNFLQNRTHCVCLRKIKYSKLTFYKGYLRIIKLWYNMTRYFI